MSIAAPRPVPAYWIPTPARWHRPWLTSLAVLVVSAGASFALFANAWRAPATSLIGQGPDPLLFSWFLRWTPFAVSHGLNPLYTDFLDAPQGANLMWNTWVPGLGGILTPITVWAGPLVAFNLAMTLCPALTAWTAYLCIRRFVTGQWPAVLGGLLYGFSPFIQAQALGHLHMVAAFCPPLMVILGHDLLRHRRGATASGVLFGVVALVQLSISEEMLAMEAVAAILAAGAWVGLAPDDARRSARRLATSGAVGAIVFGMVAAPALIFQFFGPQHIIGASPLRNVFVSDAAGFVVPTNGQALSLARSMHQAFSGTQYESGGYLGVPLLALVALSLARRRQDPLVQVAAILLVQFALLSLGITVHVNGFTTAVPVGMLAIALVPFMRLPAGRFAPLSFALTWLAVTLCPVLDNIVPARFMDFAFLAAAVLLALWCERLLELREPRVRQNTDGRAFEAWGWVLAALTLLTLAPRWPFPVLSVDSPPLAVVPQFFTAATPGVPAGSVALVAPYASNFEARAMLWQAASGMRFRIPEGYILTPGPSFNPPPSVLGQTLEQIAWLRVEPARTPDRVAAMRNDLRHWRVRSVIVGPMEGQAMAVDLMTAVLGRPPESVAGVEAWFDVRP